MICTLIPCMLAGIVIRMLTRLGVGARTLQFVYMFVALVYIVTVGMLSLSHSSPFFLRSRGHLAFLVCYFIQLSVLKTDKILFHERKFCSLKAQPLTNLYYPPLLPHPHTTTHPAPRVQVTGMALKWKATNAENGRPFCAVPLPSLWVP